MRWLLSIFVGAIVLAGAGHLSAHEEHTAGAAPASDEQTLTGEVVDAFCYLSHGSDGLGKAHADCAKKCINSGLPVALKVGDRLYLVAMANHRPANKTLAGFAGERITVSGKVVERDGQRLIAISHVERAE